MNASVALNEGMYASWIRRSYTVRYASQNLKINLKSKYNMKVKPLWFPIDE